MTSIYHIVHIDKLQSILDEGFIFSDKMIRERGLPGTDIGMTHIKERRLTKGLNSQPGLYVGSCTPFYFCPRSIMLYMYSRGNHSQLAYNGGQEPILHLKSNMEETVAWADDNSKRWAFTKSNAGSVYFEDFNDMSNLDQINWDAVNTHDWREKSIQEAKQAEFLIEEKFPWHLVQEIGVYSNQYKLQVDRILSNVNLRSSPQVEIRRGWYY